MGALPDSQLHFGRPPAKLDPRAGYDHVISQAAGFEKGGGGGADDTIKLP
jgi:hypothetical protein